MNSNRKFFVKIGVLIFIFPGLSFYIINYLFNESLEKIQQFELENLQNIVNARADRIVLNFKEFILYHQNKIMEAIGSSSQSSINNNEKIAEICRYFKWIKKVELFDKKGKLLVSACEEDIEQKLKLTESPILIFRGKNLNEIINYSLVVITFFSKDKCNLVRCWISLAPFLLELLNQKLVSIVSSSDKTVLFSSSFKLFEKLKLSSEFAIGEKSLTKGCEVVCFIKKQLHVFTRIKEIISAYRLILLIIGVGVFLIILFIWKSALHTYEREIKQKLSFLITQKNKYKDLATLDKLIEDISSQIEKKENILREIVSEKDSLTAELNEARKLQLSLLPSKLKQYKGFEFSVKYLTSRFLSGDFYDCIYMENQLCFILFDAAGKGLSASFFSAMLQTILQTALNESQELEKGFFIANNKLIDIFETKPGFKKYIGYPGVIAISIFNKKPLKVKILNAGLNVPVFLKHITTVKKLCIPSLPLGVMSNYKFNTLELKLFSDEILLAFTDGLKHLKSPTTRTYFGYRRIHELLREEHSLEKLMKKIELELLQFCNSSKNKININDDITIFGIKAI